MAAATENTPLSKEPVAFSKKMNDSASPPSSASSSTALGQSKQKATSLQITFNLITCGLGTGVFTLPWSTAGASIVPAIIIVALVLALNAWTISILVEAAERHQTFDLGSLLARLPGRLGQFAQCICNIVLWFTMFLSLVGYIIVMVDCLQTSVPENTVGGTTRQSLRPMLVSFSAASVLPLCFLDQRRLAFTSLLAMAANAGIFAFMMGTFAVEEMDGSRPSVCFFGLGPGSVAMVSATMQLVVIQMCVLPMYGELEDRSPAKFSRIVHVGFAVLFLLCVGFAVAGYATFGPSVSSNFLRNFPGTHWGHVSRIAAYAAVSGVFPIILNSMVAPLSSSEAVTSFRASSPKTVTGIATCLIVLSAMVATNFVQDLGILNVINGSICLGAFVAVVPSLVGLYLLGPASSNSYWRAAMYTLLVLGLVMSVAGVMMSDNFAPALKAACVWPRLSA